MTDDEAKAKLQDQQRIDKLSNERERLFIKGDYKGAAALNKLIEDIEGIASPVLSPISQQKQAAIKLVQAAHLAVGMSNDVLLQALPVARELPVYKNIQEVLVALGKIQNEIQKIPL